MSLVTKQKTNKQQKIPWNFCEFTWFCSCTLSAHAFWKCPGVHWVCYNIQHLFQPPRSISWSSTRKNNRDVLWGLLGNLSLHSPESLEGATSAMLQSPPSLWLRAELADFPFCITGDWLDKGANICVGSRGPEWEGAPSDSKFNRLLSIIASRADKIGNSHSGAWTRITLRTSNMGLVYSHRLIFLTSPRVRYTSLPWNLHCISA